MRKTLFSICGVMGSGKTALIQRLFLRIDNCACLDADSLWMMHPCDLTGTNGSMVVDNITHVLRNYLATPSLKCILFAWPVHLQYITDAVMSGLVAEANVDFHAVALTCTPEVLRGRMAEQGRMQLDVDLSMHRLCLPFPDGAVVLDTSDLNLAEATERLLSIIKEVMFPMISIRKMTEADDLPVSRILCDCNRLIAKPDGLTPEQRDRMILERCQPQHMVAYRDRYSCHVAEQNGNVVGFVADSGNKIEELFVDPEHHRRGIATTLFRKVETDCQDRVLTVETTGYGIPFYQAMGMHIVGNRRVTFGPLEGIGLIQLEKRRSNQAWGDTT